MFLSPHSHSPAFCPPPPRKAPPRLSHPRLENLSWQPQVTSLSLTQRIEADLRVLERLRIKPVLVFPGLLSSGCSSTAAGQGTTGGEGNEVRLEGGILFLGLVVKEEEGWIRLF